MRGYTGNIHKQPEPTGDNERLYLAEDRMLHIVSDSGKFQVWFNFDNDDFSGFIIGLGSTRDESVADAVATLEATIDKLQEPPQ